LIAAGHRGARGQHHAAAAIEQVDQRVQPVGMAGEMLDRAQDRQATACRELATLRKRKNCPVHVLLLRNLSRERHTGQTKAACDGGPRTMKTLANRTGHLCLRGAPPTTGRANGAHAEVNTMAGLRRQGRGLLGAPSLPRSCPPKPAFWRRRMRGRAGEGAIASTMPVFAPTLTLPRTRGREYTCASGQARSKLR